MSDSGSQEKPPLTPSEAVSRTPKPHRPIWKTLVLVFLALVHLACNVAVLAASYHTFRFGVRITKDTWWISDKNLLTLIALASKVLFVTTTIFGGWAISYLWSRRLSKPHTRAGLAELQSLTIFQSVPTIYTAAMHLFRNHYISSQWLYGVIITCAVLLQLYSTAVITLATPSIALIGHPPGNFQYNPVPFMTLPVNGAQCADLVDDAARTACLGITLSGSSLTDMKAFDGNVAWIPTSDLWSEVDTSYVGAGLLTGAALPLGPRNGNDFSSGAALFGINLATVQGLTNLSTPFGLKIWDALEFRVDVNTTIPLLSCQCVQGPGDTSVVTIQDQSYQLPDAVPLVPNGHIVGQVTVDGMDLVLSIPGDNNANTYCVIGLRLQSQYMSIIGTPSARSTTTFTNTLVVFPNILEVQDLTVALNASDRGQDWPLRDFASIWLGGLGWGANASQTPLVDFLRGFPIATGGSGRVGSPFLEQYMLVMLANGIGGGFSIEALDSSASVTPDNRDYLFYKWEYYLGVTSHWQYILFFIVLLDTLFVFFCTVVILYGGWYPVWTDPVTLVRVALCSNPPGISTDETHPNKPTILAQSPVSLVHGEDVDKRLWREEYSLVEVVSGDRNYLVLEVTPVQK